MDKPGSPEASRRRIVRHGSPLFLLLANISRVTPARSFPK
jgi:hypothetical protein